MCLCVCVFEPCVYGGGGGAHTRIIYTRQPRTQQKASREIQRQKIVSN